MKYFVILALLLFSSVQAQGADSSLSKAAIGVGIMSAATGQAMIQTGAQIAVQTGNLVRFGGLVTVAAGAIPLALNWFYDELKRQTGTSLDDWHRLAGTPSYAAYATKFWFLSAPSFFWEGTQYYACYQQRSHGPQKSGMGTESRFMGNGFTSSGCPTDSEVGYDPSILGNIGGCAGSYTWVNYSASGTNNSGQTVQISYALRCNALVQMPLLNWIDGNYVNPDGSSGTPHPDALSAILQQILPQWLNSRPLPLSRTQLAPFVTLSPTPNTNQWLDSISDNTLDSDGDGFTDRDEYDNNSDLNNSSVFPVRCGQNLFSPNTNCNDTINRDTDADGFTDDEELNPQNYSRLQPIPSNPQDPNSRPTLRPLTEACPNPTDVRVNGQCQPPALTCQAGFSLVSGRCVPNVCPVGQNLERGVCVPDTTPDASAINTPCDAMQGGSGVVGFVVNFFPNLMHLTKCLFIPTVDISSKVSQLQAQTTTKFPFSISAQLNSAFRSPTATASASPLPARAGDIPLDWSPIAPFLQIAKSVIGTFIWFSALWFIVRKITPQVTV